MNRNLIKAVGLAVVVALATPALAQKAAKYGGQTAVVAGHHDAELVIKPNQLVLYLTNHGKPLVPADNAIKATIQEGDKKSELLMKAEGDHAVATLAAPLAKGAIILLSGKISGGHALSARFVAK
jgi:hypothetical protein